MGARRRQLPDFLVSIEEDAGGRRRRKGWSKLEVWCGDVSDVTGKVIFNYRLAVHFVNGVVSSVIVLVSKYYLSRM